MADRLGDMLAETNDVDDAMPDTKNRSLKLAELLCARLCHELSSPLGTLAGVMEMMAVSGNTAMEAREIAEEAAAAVRSRLRLLRAAWSADCGAMQGSEIRAMAEGLRVTRFVTVDAEKLRGEFRAPAARLLLNVMLLGVEALGGRGTLRLVSTPLSDVYVSIEGPRAAWPADFEQAIRTAHKAWALVDDSRRLQAPFTAILAHDYGIEMGFEPAPLSAAEQEQDPRPDKPPMLRLRVRQASEPGESPHWPG